jgi:hypothetical protein
MSEERKSRLRSLESAIQLGAMIELGLEWRTCSDCGEEELMLPRAKYCKECRERRAAESNRTNQRRRRKRETNRRQLAAGHLRRTGYFLMRLPIACAGCGQAFTPKRSTGRYCSTRCRVAAHRAKGDHPEGHTL